jgi:hypothetical protein
MSIVEVLADLPAGERLAAARRYVELLDKRALGAVEPFRSERHDQAVDELTRDANDLAAARAWSPAA